jgi:hypothetical protein
VSVGVSEATELTRDAVSARRAGRRPRPVKGRCPTAWTGRLDGKGSRTVSRDMHGGDLTGADTADTADDGPRADLARLRANLHDVQDRITAAARAAGRDPAELTLVAVSKTWPAADVVVLRGLGVTHFAENRVQEAVRKVAEVHARLGLLPAGANGVAAGSGLAQDFVRGGDLALRRAAAAEQGERGGPMGRLGPVRGPARARREPRPGGGDGGPRADRVSAGVARHVPRRTRIGAQRCPERRAGRRRARGCPQFGGSCRSGGLAAASRSDGSGPAGTTTTPSLRPATGSCREAAPNPS